jgi:hypothetical protein
MKRNSLILICVTVLLSVTGWSDHLDDDHVARTRPEHVLVGINVWRDQYKNPHSLNPAARVVQDSPNDRCTGQDCGGEEEVRWEGLGCIIRVWGMYPGPNKMRGVVGVEVVPGSGGSGRGCATGRGLALSDPFQKAIALYENRYFVSRKDSTGMNVLYEWKDGGQMDLEMDGDEKIIKIGLGPGEGGLRMR